VSEFAVSEDGEHAGHLERRAAKVHAVRAQRFTQVSALEEAAEFAVERAPYGRAPQLRDVERAEPTHGRVNVATHELVERDSVLRFGVAHEGEDRRRAAGFESFALA
jgi:hypothetical protein